MVKNYSLVLVLLTFLSGLTLSYSQITGPETINFDTADNTNLGPVAIDGEGGSTDITGVQIDIIAINASGIATNADLFYNTSGIPGFEEGLSITTDPISTAWRGVSITSNDGTEFDFQGFDAAEFSFGADLNVNVEGFKDGASTGSVTLTLLAGNVNAYSPSDFPNSVFGDVDEVRIITDTDYFGTFDTFQFDIVSGGGGNSAPVVTAPSPPSVLEDVNTTLADNIQVSDVDPGDTQTVTILVTGGAVTLGTTGITFGGGGNGSSNFTAQGSLTDINFALDAAIFSPISDFNGNNAGSIAITSNDGTVDSNTATVMFDIIAVNDAPSFTIGADQFVDENAGAQTVNGWATAISAGPSNENSQTLTFNVSNDNNAIFSVQPAVDASGILTYTPSADGVATVTLNLSDNGGTANGGIDTSANQTFTITVNAVNTPATIGGVTSGAVTEDTGAVINEALTISDPDTGEDNFNTTPVINALYGTFIIDATGNWSYDLDDTNSTVNALSEGAPLQDVITVASTDGTQQQITINITGANDAALIAGVTSGATTEDSGAVINDALTITDPDTGEDNFNTTPVINAVYGTFSIDASGNWSYDLDDTNSTVNALPLGASLQDVITVASTDDTQQQITINITGANDAAVIGGVSSGTVTEDSGAVINEALTITDPDTGEDNFSTTPVVNATYGTFSIDPLGNWSYDLDDTNASVDALNDGDTLEDVITIESDDGTQRQITVNINGTTDGNTPPTILPELGLTIVEESLSVGDVVGIFSANDPDASDTITFSITTGNEDSYFTIDNNGNVTLTSTGVSAINSDVGVDLLSLVIGAIAFDGTDSSSEAQVTVTINRVSDNPPSIDTAAGSAITEEAISVGEIVATFMASDLDDQDLLSYDISSGNADGYFVIDDNGNVTLTSAGVAAINSDVGVDLTSLNVGVTASDGPNSSTQAQVTITINRINDNPNVFNGDIVGEVVENSTTPITGQLSISDLDDQDNPTINTTPVSGASYGTFSINASGSWSYTLDNSNTTVNELDPGESLQDVITIVSGDGTEQQITITITGASDCPPGVEYDPDDLDGDGFVCDAFPFDASEWEDTDGDGIGDNSDNCPSTANADQADADGDGIGDLCDNCRDTANRDQADENNDGVGDACEQVEITVPTAYTPNGDGVNDAWIIPGINNVANNKVTIFNRYGTVVFEQENYDNTWSGTGSGGANLPDGAYYYVIEIPNKNARKGYLMILR
ncbi:VCBS domain-containing protein [Aquimarina brevivitae]|uniref:Gliding motility-associated-like protein n=1 Tax=Aquimarina brevivitae TaxID=323412 RepID=A0A4Q7NTT1_9FLAO|nr:VCBS domain-containing protein [Aquimarina brevivitae]RZS90596.1 gliding motility-associated-like protein [Aquimarina brevivitae]